jgi:hypothetical protein
MIRDGCSRVYSTSSPYWTVSFRLHQEREPGLRRWTYLEFGSWMEVPRSYDLAAITRDLLALVKDSSAPTLEVLVTKHGIVSVDSDRQLLLAPQSPGGARRQ